MRKRTLLGFAKNVESWALSLEAMVQHRDGALPFRKTRYQAEACTPGACSQAPHFKDANEILDHFRALYSKYKVADVLLISGHDDINQRSMASCYMVAHRRDKPHSAVVLGLEPAMTTNKNDLAKVANLPWHLALSRTRHLDSGDLVCF